MIVDKDAEQLANILDLLPYVEVVDYRANEGSGHVQAICRVQRKAETRWAKLIEGILRAEQITKEEFFAWETHVCRAYFLKNDSLVYGWHVSIKSEDIETTLAYWEWFFGAHLQEESQRQEKPKKKVVTGPSHPRKATNPKQNPPKDPPRPKTAEVDENGYPRVPKHMQLESMPLPGLEGKKDRNVPVGNGPGAAMEGTEDSRLFASRLARR